MGLLIGMTDWKSNIFNEQLVNLPSAMSVAVVGEKDIISQNV